MSNQGGSLALRHAFIRHDIRGTTTKKIMEESRVERIDGAKRAKARDGRGTYYLVKRAGEELRYWEPASSLTDCQDKIDEFKSRTSGNVGRMPLVPVVDDAGSGTAPNPVPILARSPPGGASRLIGSGEGMSAPSGLDSGDDRDRAHVAFGSVSRSPHRVCEEGCDYVVVNGCSCDVCYDNEEDEEIFDFDEDDEYAFMNRIMRIRPGCHRRAV
jgi:hypothetical protein